MRLVIEERDELGRIRKKPPEYFIQRDIKALNTEAKYVLTLESDGISAIVNENGQLNVVAIIGPTGSSGNGCGAQKGLLCEVGFYQVRPYRIAKKPDRKPGEKRKFWARHSCFSLSTEQYTEAASHIFSLLQKITDEKCSMRKCGPDNPFYAPSVHNYWSRGREKLFSRQVYRPRIYGLRFSVSRKDVFLLQDVFWASLNCQEMRKKLNGLACFINMRLEPYRKGYRRKFGKLLGPQQITEIIKEQNIPVYLLAEMLERYLRGGKKNPFWHELCDLLEWDQYEPEQITLARNCLPNPLSRTNGIQIRITGEKKDYVIFEVLPSMQEPQVFLFDEEEPF